MPIAIANVFAMGQRFGSIAVSVKNSTRPRLQVERNRRRLR